MNFTMKLGGDDLFDNSMQNLKGKRKKGQSGIEYSEKVIHLCILGREYLMILSSTSRLKLFSKNLVDDLPIQMDHPFS